MGVFNFFTRAEPTDTIVGADESTIEPSLRACLDETVMTPQMAMNIPAVAGCVNKICDTVGMIPVKLYKNENGAITEVKNDRRIDLLNRDTGDALDAVQFKRAIARDYFLGKGGYAYINRAVGGIESLHYVDECNVSYTRNTDVIFKKHKFLVQAKSYEPFDFLSVLRNSKNGIVGQSIIEDSPKMLSVAYNSILYEETLVKTGGNKKGFVKSARKLGKDAIEALKSAWRRLYANNTENVIVLNDGLEFQESSNTSVEMQLNENKESNSNDICKLFGMTPSIINGGATEEDKKEFQSTIIQYLSAFDCALNRDLLLEAEKGSYFFASDTNELTKADIEKRYRAYAVGTKNGFIQTDEIREKENLPALGMNWIKLGLQDVLFNPKTSEIFIPNMNAKSNLNDAETLDGKGGVES